MTDGLRVGPTVACEVAAAYVDAADRRDAVTVAAFAQVVTETDQLFRWIAQPSRPNAQRVFFTTCKNPCRDAQERFQSGLARRALGTELHGQHSVR